MAPNDPELLLADTLGAFPLLSVRPKQLHRLEVSISRDVNRRFGQMLRLQAGNYRLPG